ncbi:MAG: APC family permease, partial [Armatimonadetes bacterium]|nr:APC family permease [Armatimonadota bacterium]
MQSALRKLIFGTPFETAKAHHTLLPNILALPVFASDALSSVSYATEEILLVLVTTGLAVGSYSLGLSLPIGLAIAVLLAIVTTSYRQTIAAYPQGGGAYRVAKENLGQYAGLVAASALLFAYVMTVAVSVSAGVAAVTSALPELSRWQVPLAVGFVLFIAMANLRGAKESGLLFAAPTYLFIVTVITMLVV